VRDPSAKDADEVVFDAARCFQSGKSITAALFADSIVIKYFAASSPSSARQSTVKPTPRISRRSPCSSAILSPRRATLRRWPGSRSRMTASRP
jgi:hypothetical protein